jgi:hypothetical protein
MRLPTKSRRRLSAAKRGRISKAGIIRTTMSTGQENTSLVRNAAGRGCARPASLPTAMPVLGGELVSRDGVSSKLSILPLEKKHTKSKAWRPTDKLADEVAICGHLPQVIVGGELDLSHSPFPVRPLLRESIPLDSSEADAQGGDEALRDIHPVARCKNGGTGGNHDSFLEGNSSCNGTELSKTPEIDLHMERLLDSDSVEWIAARGFSGMPAGGAIAAHVSVAPDSLLMSHQHFFGSGSPKVDKLLALNALSFLSSAELASAACTSRAWMHLVGTSAIAGFDRAKRVSHQVAQGDSRNITPPERWFPLTPPSREANVQSSRPSIRNDLFEFSEVATPIVPPPSRSLVCSDPFSPIRMHS